MIYVTDVRHKKQAYRINVSRRAHHRDDMHAKDLGNPYRPTYPGSTLEDYWSWLQEDLNAQDAIEVLAFQHETEGDIELACWCGGAKTCHANVIKEILESESV